MNETNLTSQYQRTAGSKNLFAWRLILPSFSFVPAVALLLGFVLLCAQGCGDKGTDNPKASSQTKSGDGDGQPDSQTQTETSQAEPPQTATSQTATSQTATAKDRQSNDATQQTVAADRKPITNDSHSTGKTPTAGKAELVSFDDLKLGMPVDTKFRPKMLTYNESRVKQLFAKRIIVAGYMDPTDSMKGVKEFILLRNLECKFGPGGQADHLVRIYLPEGETTSYTNKIVYVEGTLVLNPFPDDPQEPITWSIYDLEDSTVSTRRPR